MQEKRKEVDKYQSNIGHDHTSKDTKGKRWIIYGSTMVGSTFHYQIIEFYFKDFTCQKKKKKIQESILKYSLQKISITNFFPLNKKKVWKFSENNNNNYLLTHSL